MNYDTSTIDGGELKKLPLYRKPPTFHLQEEPGNGCSGDPPGYPTYFTQSVYTGHGNTPTRGAQLVIFGRVLESSEDLELGKDYEEVRQIRDERTRRLWKPLPLDHPRTRAWIRGLYTHFRHCYYDENSKKSDKTLIYPVPEYELKQFVDDQRFSEGWRKKEREAVEQANKEITEGAKKIATPENQKAVIIVRLYYPDYQPEVDLIENPPKHEGNWWERLAEKPTPETCPGEHGRKHPVNTTWCQMCGWHPTEAEIAEA